MKTHLLSVCLLLAFSGAGWAADNVTATFQKGLFEEEGNQNLEAAIQAYQSVLSQLDQQRKIAATTVFRLGECYRKLGKTNEATAQYQRVVREFSDQEMLAKLSQQNLAALGTPSAVATKKDLVIGPPSQDAVEVERIRVLIRNSPDLINALDPLSYNGSQTPLQQAANRSQLNVVRFLLENRADVDGTGNQGRTPLLFAAEAGHKTIVELLLAHGANVNAGDAFGETALYKAITKGYRAVAETLIAAKADVNTKKRMAPDGGNGLLRFVTAPLHSAVLRNDQRAVELLLSHGANTTLAGIDGVTPLHFAAALGHVEIGKLLIEKGANQDALIGADLVYAKPILPGMGSSSSGNVDVYCRGFTPLHLAALNSKTEMARLLISRKANVNVKATWDRTPLNLAAFYGDAEIVRLLLESGADVNASARDSTSYPLHAAIARRSRELVEIILAHKPNLEVRNLDGRTPLLQAFGLDDPLIVKRLLDVGADPNSALPSNMAGKTFLHLAVEARNMQYVEALLAHKANVVAVDASGKTPLDYAKSQAPAQTSQSQSPGILLGSMPSIPPGTVRHPAAGQPSPISSGDPVASEIAELLRKAGGKDDLQRNSSIRIGRAGAYYPVFFKGTNDPNRYSLFEVLASFFRSQRFGQAGQVYYGQSMGSPLPFPDFANVIVRRLTPEGETRIKVDVEAAFQLGDCSKDMGLEWGDILEIPETDHKLNEFWSGLTAKATAALQKCSARRVKVVVKGLATEIALDLFQEGGFVPLPATPGLPTQPGASSEEQVLFLELQRIRNSGTTPTEQKALQVRVASFRLKEVLYGSNLLLKSSDLTRVKVTRLNPPAQEKKELVLNLEQTDPKTDLWLRDGDAMEVPERE